MKATGRQFAPILLLMGSWLLLGLGSCGGRGGGAARSDSEGGADAVTGTGTSSVEVGGVGASGSGGAVGTRATGGHSAVGGNSAGGGSSSPVTIAPRTPAEHRETASACELVHAAPEPPEDLSLDYECRQHADCTDGVNGKCVHGIRMASAYYCVYDSCATDEDCETGEVCHCTSDSAARCLSVGNCQTDADCGGGAYSFCSPTRWNCGGNMNIVGYQCHAAVDSCLDDSDCAPTDFCNFDEYVGRWTCTAIENNCVIG